MKRTLALVGWLVGMLGAASPGVAAPFQDALVQAPSLAAPQRGSVAGTLSRLAFGPGDLDRGAFMLPLPIDTPSERGPLLAKVVPGYSPETGIGEWGVGWSTDLAIKRVRPRGEINFVDDDFTSPWGRLVAGDDGTYYPAGLTSVVRVAPDGAGGWVAETGDGTHYSFHAADAVTAPGGAFAWMLSRVDTINGDATTLDWARNASGRAFLTAAHWGGRGDGTQYRMSLTYDTLATPFTAYAAGAPQVVDRRVSSVAVEVQSAGTYQTRWRYDLGYASSPSGPAFYLQTITRTFASGQSDPPITYDYDLNVEHLASAQLARVPRLDSFLAVYGSIALQPDHAAITDLEQDGLPDVESNLDLQTAHQSLTGFTIEPLPAATGTNSICRPSPSAVNQPRQLARMHGDATAPQVVAARASGSATRMLICDRLGVPIHDENLAGNWQPAANVKLADLDLDHQPDFVRVGAGAVFVLRNTSTSPTNLSFAPGPTTFLTPAVSPVSSWILDFNGDGRPDLVERTNVSLVVWLGKGNGTFETAGTTYYFRLSNGSLYSSLSPWQFSFGDYNADGLTDVILSQGQNLMVFTNRGGGFGQVAVPGLQGIPWTLSLPLIQDLAGSGNEAATFANGAQGMAIELTTASTGLLRSADDGKGTVVSFGYDRVAPAAGIGKRHSVLSALTMASSGYDSLSVAYHYGTPVMHTIGKYLVGFASVDKQSPFLTEHAELINDNDVAAVPSLSEQTDDRTPGIIKLSQHTYDDVRFHNVRWLRPAQIETGYRSADNAVRLTSTTQYVTYERGHCPTVAVAHLPDGQLVTATTLASVASIADDLQCLSASQRLLGTHGNAALDFNYLVSFARNDLGQVTNVTQYDAAMASLDLQDVTYTADHRLATINAPGHGTRTIGYDSAGRIASVTEPTGVITQAAAFDPITETMTRLDIARPGAPTSASFRFDGRERLQASWDDVSGGNSLTPMMTYSYQDATHTAPGRIDTEELADIASGTKRRQVSLLTASGEAMAGGSWLGDHYSLGRSSIDDRGALTHRSAFIGALTSAALSALTSDDLRALGAPLDTTTMAGFGHAIQSTVTHQDGVVGTSTSELVLSASELVTRGHDAGGYVSEAASDGAGRLVRKLDENGAVHRYAYDALGRLVHVATPDGGQGVSFDGFGRPGTITRDGIGAVSYGYDAVTGLVIHKQWLDAAGLVVDRNDTAYDAIGRQLRITQSTGSDASDLVFDYDGELDASLLAGQLGRLTRARGDGWARTTVFDALGRVSEQHTSLTGWREVTSEKTYRVDGAVASDTLTITDSAGAPTLVRTEDSVLDALGRVSALEVNGAVLYTLSYDGEGRIAHASFTSGEQLTFDYDPATHDAVGHSLASAHSTGGVAWQRDARGMVVTETYSNGTSTTLRTYAHDGRGALTSAVSGAETDTYTYTASGLPDSIHDVAGTRAVHRSSNSLTLGDTTYTWDAAGRVIGKGEWTFAYGGNGQLSRATRPGHQIDFAYDDGSQRILKKLDGAPVRGTVAGGVLTEGHFVELVTIGGVVAGVLDNGQFTALLTDPRGTPVADSTGAANLATPYGVRSTPLDEAEVIDYAQLGLDPDLAVVRMGVRDYDAVLGQFWTPDPLYFESLEKCQSSPLGCALYGYAGGDPIGLVDPSGLDPAPFVQSQNGIPLLYVGDGRIVFPAQAIQGDPGIETFTGTRIPTSDHAGPLAPRQVYTNHIAADDAAHGFIALAELAEAGHGCAYCHVQHNLNRKPRDEELDLYRYFQGSGLVAGARMAFEALPIPDPSVPSNCFVAGTLVRTPRGAVAIETLRLGDRVEAGNPACDDSHLDNDTLTLELELVDVEGAVYHAELARPRRWLDDHLLADGDVALELYEIQPFRTAHLTSISPGPVEQPGPGCLVLMTIEHRARQLVKLTLATGTVIEATPPHPFYVESRGWVPASELRPGMVLRSDRGAVGIAAIAAGAPDQDVFNLEVDVEHTYRVSTDQIWVHNAYPVRPKLERYEGRKPTYHVNEAHVPGPKYNPHKEILPADAEAVYQTAVPNSATEAGAPWFGKNDQGIIYRYSNSNNNTAHFSGSSLSKDGIRNMSDYAKDRLGVK